MKIQIKPLDRKTDRLFLRKPSTAQQFRKNELLQVAAGRSFVLDLATKSSGKPWVEIEVTDGRKHKFHVEVLDRFVTKYQCSCEDFVLDESGCCAHVAAIENVRANQAAYKKQDPGVGNWCSRMNQQVMMLPFSLSGFKNPKFVFYDASAKQEVSYGGNLPGSIATVAVSTARRLRAQRIATQSNTSLPDQDDADLLREVSLYDYQKIVFNNMVKAKRAICSMTMGSGKTLVSLACYSWVRKTVKPNARLLVVCPKSLRLQWAGEIQRVLDMPSVQVMKTTDLENKTKGDVFIATYQFFTRHCEEFAKQEYDCVVVDEVQFVKNNETKTWKAISKVRSEYFYGLSGTVIENRLDDLYSIMEIIDPGRLGPKWKFDDKFQNLLVMSKTKALYKGVKNLPELRKELQNHVFSYDDLVLPKITHNYVRTTLSHAEQTTHDGYMEEARKLIAKVLNGSGRPQDRLLIQAFLLKARQACNGDELLTKKPSVRPSSKIREFLNIVDEVCVQNDEKLVVFSEWTEMLDICKRFLGGSVGYVSYTGAESTKQRQAALTKFQKDPDCKIFFSSDAGGVGLDGLQLVCSNVLHSELPWNPSRLDQRTGRVYRLLQKKDVSVYYLISNGAIELQIQKLLTEKREIRTLTLKDLSVV